MTDHESIQPRVMRTVAALFVRSDSIYKSMDGVECWDIDRDALLFPGGMSIVAHPPCRAWGRLRHMSKPRHGEKHLAVWAVRAVRRWGGVLEHPMASSLFAHCKLPRPNDPPDKFGGYTIRIDQRHFGHRCDKATWLYIVGVAPSALPPWEMDMAPATAQVARSSRKRLPHCSKREREATPPRLAEWLVEIARIADAARR